ncbi:fatty acid desaturase 6-like isoform X1 [Tachysurus vachellii]|uniref:fatty acid desaturase 6-like isoform X1 n=1 Tax=Tachysurus vachellii TaxID=175792 RepID=UPI00296B31DC|nr:fatty acid desaturase 6-like isoform X1 [Tachysurus vachellii]XP_060749170.1 fatty acid desaturase 6-like isoform X1 [Tachysurus vachellii]
MQHVPEEWTESEERKRSDEGQTEQTEECETLMMELTQLVHMTVRDSSWWDRRGLDCTILASVFIILPIAFLLLSSPQVCYFMLGLVVMGLAHAVITVKGTHLASHGVLTESTTWTQFWNIFFTEVCGAFTAKMAVKAHVKTHHAHTNVIGLGDSSTWKIPFLPRSVYLFIAPLAVPVITPVVAMGLLKGQPLSSAVHTVMCMCIGVCSQYVLLRCVSGLECSSALLVMLLSRAMFSIPYIHVNIFQHIGLPMFSQSRRPKRIYQMSYGVLNLSRNPLLDWTFGHSLINCHVEHHLFPSLSDNMCLKVKPIVSQFLKMKALPYQEEDYLSRLRLFFHRYQELMVFAPPITELVGVQ